MTRALIAWDRLAGLVLGLLLVAGGLLLLDWRYAVLLDLRPQLDTAQVADVAATAWWPWVFAAAGVVLGLLGLWWLLAHLRRVGPSSMRLAGSDETGRLEVDLRSLAAAAADRYAAVAPVTDVKGSTRTQGSHTLVELRGHVDRDADVESLLAATRTCMDEVARGFPADAVSCRVVLDAPRRTRDRRVTSVKVQ